MSHPHGAGFIRRIRTRSYVVAGLLFVLAICAMGKTVAIPLPIVNRLHESSHFDGWIPEKPFSYSIQRQIQDQNDVTYRFEWRKADWDGKRHTKGTELKTRPMPGLKEQWASAEFYLPYDSFGRDSKFTIIMQYHSVPDFFLGEKWRNPVSSLVMRNGRLQYDFRASADAVTPKIDGKWKYTHKGSIALGRPAFNTWNKITIYQRFDQKEGAVKIWLNGVPYEKSPVAIGFNDWIGMFFKFGLYCPEQSDQEKKIIFFRNVQLSSSPPEYFPDTPITRLLPGTTGIKAQDDE